MKNTNTKKQMRNTKPNQLKPETKENSNTIFPNHKGRFISIQTFTRNSGPQSYSAKILKESSHYVTFLNVKNGEVVKVAKSSII